MDRSIRWEKAMEWPLTIIALVFLVAYALPIAIPDVPASVSTGCDVVVWTAWAVFAADYVIRFVMASGKWRFVKSNLLDLAVVALPLLRPLRLIRLLALLSILHRTGTQELRGKVVVYAVGGIALLGVVMATIASWLVQRVSEVAETEESATRTQVDLLTSEVAALRAELRARSEQADEVSAAG